LTAWLSFAAIALVAGCGSARIHQKPAANRGATTSQSASPRKTSPASHGSNRATGSTSLFGIQQPGRTTCGRTLETSTWPKLPPRGGSLSPAGTEGYTALVASAIEARIKSECHLAATIFCPAEIPRERGYDFTCVVTIRTEIRGQMRLTRSSLTVFQTSDRGNITLRAPKVRGP
jgi:hypothetical protein